MTQPKRKAATQQSTSTSQQTKKPKPGQGQVELSEQEAKRQKTDTENVVPGPEQVELPEQGGPGPSNSAMSPSNGMDEAMVSASTRNLIAIPWGVEPPETAPTLPNADASLSHADALKYVKEISAYVVAKLPKFFNDHKQDFLAFGFEVNDDMHPSAYEALALPSSVAALVLVGWFRWWVVRCGIGSTSQVFHLCKSGCSGILWGGGWRTRSYASVWYYYDGKALPLMATLCH